MKQRTFALIAVLLICTLPISIAQELTLQTYSGKKGIPGIASRDDTITISVLASLPSTLEQGDITPDQVRLLFTGTTLLFERCEKKGTVYSCTHNASAKGLVGKEEYTVVLYTDDNQEAARKTFTILTDTLAPTITSFDINPATVREGPVQLSYTAQDPGECSGIQEIQFIINGKVVLNDVGNKQCSQQNILTYTPTPKTNYEQTNICAKATDSAGQTSTPSCKTLTVDKNPPNPTTVRITDTSGRTLTHARSRKEQPTDILVTIVNEDDIDPQSVTADLSALAPSTGVKRYDDVTGNVYAWRNIPVSIPNCKVGISAIDTTGNALQNKQLTCTLAVDDTAPEPLSINTRTTRNGIPILGVTGVVTADFKETGSGMVPENTFLNAQNIGGSTVRADTCQKIINDTWRCTWKVVPKISGLKNVSIVQTTDALGNPAKELSQQVEVDLNPPQVSSNLTLKITHTGTEEYKDLTIVGDTLEVTATGKGIDDTLGNFTVVGGGLVQGTCEDKETTTCSFSTSIQNSGPYTASLHFSFSDLAGNSVERSTSIQVAGVKDEPNPNHWRMGKVTCSPSIIDRSTISIAPHPVFCTLKLITENKNAVPVITTLPDPSLCKGSGVEQGFITNAELINNGLGKKNPILKLELGPADITANDITFSCPLEIRTKIGDFVVTNPEQENVSVKLDFYNLPLGELAKNVDEEVDDAINQAEALGDWIGTVDKIIGYAQKICTVKSTISSVIGAIDAILLTLAAVGTAAKIIPGGASVAQSAEQARVNICQGKGPLEEFVYGPAGEQGKGIAGGLTPLFNILDKFCLFATCRMAQSKEKGAEGFILNTGAFLSGGGVAGVNWCESAQNILSLGAKDILREQQVSGEPIQQQIQNKYSKSGGVQQLVDVKESLIWSTVCLCVPGIFHNINKIRQIQCKYATCMARDVKERGIPLSFCKDQRSQQLCKFVIGEIFMLFPLVQIFDQFLNMFKEAFANPFAAVSLLTGCLCGGCKFTGLVADFCKEGAANGALYGICITGKTLAKVGDAVASIQGIINKDTWKTGNDFCEELEDVKSKRKEKTPAPETTLTKAEKEGEE